MKTYIVGFDWGDVHLVTKVYANNKKEAGQLLKKEWGEHHMFVIRYIEEEKES